MKFIYLLVMILGLLLIVTACQNTSSEKTLDSKNRYSEAVFENSTFIADKKYRVYLPPSYYLTPQKKYPVLYMMDGNNLFSNSEAMGGMSWNAHTVADSLAKTNTSKEFIIVGVDHAAEKRFAEYMPQRPTEAYLKTQQDSLLRIVDSAVYSDKFLKFLVTELKLYIDQHFRTKSRVEDTYIGGASMGGLISMYAVCEYSAIFGAALCLSTHWSVSLDDRTPEAAQALIAYFESNIPKEKKWYFDYGTESLDQYYEAYQIQIDAILEKNGYRRGEDWLTKKYDGQTHNEMAWNRRLHIPFTFAFKK